MVRDIKATPITRATAYGGELTNWQPFITTSAVIIGDSNLYLVAV